MDAESFSPSSKGAAVRRLVKTQRALQVILGLFWILDAALQFQPFMFGKAFVNANILANASGQPAVVSWLITNVGHWLEPHIALWNTLFALIQLVIGGGLLFRRTVRTALAISFAWVLGVWVFGEGLGLLLTGAATALTGAPGSVLMYGLIGMMAWPITAGSRQTAVPDGDIAGPVGVASSAAGQGIGAGATALAVWSGYWVLAAVLFVLPQNRTPTSVSSAVVGMAPGQPDWFARFLNSIGRDLTSAGHQSPWLLAAASLIIGLGPLWARRPQLFLWAGALLSIAFWVTGQGLVGGIFTGSSTDPNTGPLVVLLALAMVPAVLADRTAWTSPISALRHRYPAVAVGVVLATALALLLSATYPAAAPESADAAMSGMVGMSDTGSGSASAASAGTASCTAGNSGTTRSGLDVTNTPYMVMGGHNLGMDMNGADATAAAGLNTTKANWHYTGPPLSSTLANELLADGPNGPDDIHMAATGCSSEPTFSQQINATQYVQSTSQAVGRFDNPLAALAAGYVAVSPTTYPVVYYVNPTVASSNATAKRTLNANDVDGLIYVKTPSGQEVLAAAFYLLPATVTRAPMPFGPLVQWHQRTAVCGAVTGTSAALAISGVPPCASGSVQRATPYLTMVWQIPVAGGPLAIQPPDIQIVEAAIMQTSGS